MKVPIQEEKGVRATKRSIAFVLMGLIVAVLIVGVSGTASAAHKGHKKHHHASSDHKNSGKASSSLSLKPVFPLNGSVFDVITSEFVLVNGNVDVAPDVALPPNPIRNKSCQVNVRLDGTGIGQTSGAQYRAFGADHFTPPSPCINNTFSSRVNFKLAAVNSIPIGLPPNPIRFPVDISVTFDQDGNFTGGSATMPTTTTT